MLGQGRGKWMYGIAIGYAWLEAQAHSAGVMVISGRCSGIQGLSGIEHASLEHARLESPILHHVPPLLFKLSIYFLIKVT